MREARIRIVVADDHGAVRRIMCGMLEQEGDLHVVGEACDGEEAFDLTERLKPDVVLMDVSMPKVNGLVATERIRGCCPDVKVIGLSMNDAEMMAPRMQRAGAVAYVQKGEPLEDLTATIRRIAR